MWIINVLITLYDACIYISILSTIILTLDVNAKIHEGELGQNIMA